MAVCSEIHTKHINTAVWAERRTAECSTWWYIQWPLCGTFSDHSTL